MSYPGHRAQGYAKRSAPSGGGGRSHPPGQPFGSGPRNTEVWVETNQHKLQLSVDKTSSMSDYVQCRVTIENAGYRRVKDETTGEFVRDANGDYVTEWKVFESTLESKEKLLKTPLPWRIIKKWASDTGKDIAYDGASTAYFPSAAAAPGEDQYRVQAKKDCPADDPDADSVRDRWFSVTFKRTNVITSKDTEAALRGDNSDASEAIATMFTAVLKTTAILADHQTLEAKSSIVFSSPVDMREGQLGKVNQESRDRLKFILEGMRMTVKLQSGGMVVEIEPVPQYINKERNQDNTRVPLLSVKGRENVSIAGVRVGSPHRPITNARQREEIEELIRKKTVNVVYDTKKGGNDVRKVLKNKSVRVNQRPEDTLGNGKSIIWNPSDFPVELVHQALSKSKENTEEMVNEVLKYHDLYAGKKYIERVGTKLEKLKLAGGEGHTFRDRLRRWNIEIDSRPVVEKAKILPAPKITFKNMDATPNNGSFNLHRVTFARPAQLNSFAVVNFAPGKNRTVDEFIGTVLRVSQNHGIVIPSTTVEAAGPHLDRVTEHYRGPDAVGDALDAAKRAIQRAKNFHLYDSSGFYRDRKVFFKTHCFSDQQSEFECLVLPPDKEGGPLGLLLDYTRNELKKAQYFSHRVTTHNGDEHLTRLKVRIRESKKLIDPLDFRYHDGRPGCPDRPVRYQACREDGSWHNVHFVGYCYECKAGGLVLSEREIRSKQFLHFAENWEVDFPSVLFVCLPDDGMALYHRIKVLSNYLGGCTTQCAVMTKFESQRNKDQYASNIATKLNAKLATTFEKAVSWTSKNGGLGSEDKLTWIGDRPTLVIGVGMVHQQGRAGKTVFAASVCLDSGCMRLSHSCFVNRRSDTILHLEMKDIVKRSIKHYEIENNCLPERILFYRDGLSDGFFSQADTEIKSIREAAEESLGKSIPITFVICQSGIGFKMVPHETKFIRTRNGQQKPINNVDSGTVLECGDNKSWYLVAHGGLKGTSKPVKYRAYLNENEHSGLTIQNLIECTNQMSFKYPSATKAVREVPVLKYAKRLGNQVLNSLLVLETGCDWFGQYIRLVCPVDDSLPEADRRPYVESRDADTGAILKTHNLVEIPFRNHLAA